MSFVGALLCSSLGVGLDLTGEAFLGELGSFMGDELPGLSLVAGVFAPEDLGV